MATKKRLFLFHWNGPEAAERAKELRALGFMVATESEDGARGGGKVKASPPDAILIDLGRLPSHGREVGHYFQFTKATRSIPLVFVGGEGEALAKTKAKVPTAVYTTREALPGVLRKLA
jgi:hypothetical protein